MKLYFPRYLAGEQAGEACEEDAAPVGSEAEVVLVVEDNDDVRAYSVMVLTELGYIINCL